MWLPDGVFRTVLAATPLVSIDLLVENPQGEILLGRRLNRPAQGFWFVPGGRIRKNETLDAAFLRLTRDELGVAINRCEARLLDIYEHFYADSVFSERDANLDTHYVVIGFHLRLAMDTHLELPADQHDCYRWLSKSEMQARPEVHDNSRAYLAALNLSPEDL